MNFTELSNNLYKGVPNILYSMTQIQNIKCHQISANLLF